MEPSVFFLFLKWNGAKGLPSSPATTHDLGTNAQIDGRVLFFSTAQNIQTDELIILN
jgi:hypothetical protein